MSMRLSNAIRSGSVRVKNRSHSTVSVTIPTREGRKVVKNIINIQPGRTKDLTRTFSPADIKKSETLKGAIKSRLLRVVDT